MDIGGHLLSFFEVDVALSNFKRAPKIELSTAHPGRQT
jgi:hypothetical protein